VSLHQDIRPISVGEDDLVQLHFADTVGGANAVSPREGQRTYAALGAREARFVKQVRPPRDDDQRDAGWRPSTRAGQ
jgi:hypothetical protein